MRERRDILGSRVKKFAMVVAISGVLLAADGALAQRGRGRGGGGGGGGGGGRPTSVGRTLLNRQNGGFTTGLSGVRAELPRPIANRGSLLPPLPSGHGGGHGPNINMPGFNNGFYGGNPFRTGFNDGTRIQGGFDSNSGFRLRGSVNDDNFRLRFSLNPGGVGAGPLRNDWRHDDGHDHHHHHSNYSPLYRYWPYADLWGLGWWNGYYDNYYDNYYQPQPVYGQPVYVDPSLLGMQPQAQQPATPPPPPTPLEQADIALYQGRVPAAIQAYRDHLEKNPDDADAMRSLAIALVQNKKVKEAVALLALAYQKDPSLVHKPMDPQMVYDGTDDFREVLISTVHFSNRMKTSSGYLAVVAMMQAEGRNPQALKILQKAKAAGLEENLAREFENELAR